ncbi:MAG: hypothetical protein AB8H80_02220 [Planctomycetota bacterium]
MPAAIAAGVGSLACLLPWYTVDFAAAGQALEQSMGKAFGGQSAGMQGMGDAMSSMLGGLGLQGSATASGIDAWFGIVALLVFGTGAVLHLLSTSSATDEASRKNLLLGAVALSIVGSACALFGLGSIGGPVSPHIGLVVAILAGGAATALSLRRLNSPAPARRRVRGSTA